MIHLDIDGQSYLLNFVHAERHYVIGPFAQWVDIEIGIAAIEETGLDEVEQIKNRFGASIAEITGTVAGVEFPRAAALKLYLDLFGDWEKIKDDAERGIYNKKF